MKKKVWVSKDVIISYSTVVEAESYWEALRIAKKDNDNINWKKSLIREEEFCHIDDTCIVDDNGELTGEQFGKEGV